MMPTTNDVAPQHLRAIADDRGHARMPALNCTYGGEIRLRESRDESGPHFWIDAHERGSEGVTLHLHAATAWKFAEQIITAVLNHHQGDAMPNSAAYAVIPLLLTNEVPPPQLRPSPTGGKFFTEASAALEEALRARGDRGATPDELVEHIEEVHDWDYHMRQATIVTILEHIMQAAGKPVGQPELGGRYYWTGDDADPAARVAND